MIHPSPWHRSRLFWLGLPGLLFLLWAWFLSGSILLLSWGNPSTILRLSYQPGVLSLSRTTIPKVSIIAIGPGNGFNTRVIPIDPADRNYFHWNLQLTNDKNAFDPNYHTRQLTLPFWLLVPLYLTAWLTTLTLWQRRKHRLLENPTTIPTP